MNGLIKETFKKYRAHFFKYFILSILFVSLIQMAIQLLSRLGPQGNTSDLLFLLSLLRNASTAEEFFYQISGLMDMTGDMGSLWLNFGISSLVMSLSYVYAIFVTPLYSWMTIRLTGQSTDDAKHTLKQLFRDIKGHYWQLVLIGICIIVYSSVMVMVLMLLYMVLLIPVIALGAAIAAAAKTWVVVTFVAVLMLFIALIGSLILSNLILFAYPAMILDGQRHVHAVVRSIRVAWKRIIPITVIMLLLGLIISLGAAIVLGLFALPVLLGNAYSPILWPACIGLISALTSPLMIIASVLIYQRISPEVPLPPSREEHPPIRLTAEVSE